MPKPKQQKQFKSDGKTLAYLIGLMNSLPMRLFDLVKELKENSNTIRQKARQLLKDLESINTRIEMLEQIVEELCDVASASMAIGPMMKIMKGKKGEEWDHASVPPQNIEEDQT